MINKYFNLFLLLFLNFCTYAQKNYIRADLSFFQLRSAGNGQTVNGLFEKTNNSTGNYFGGSYHIAMNRAASFNCGMGLSKISFQKETQGIFPETNQYGLAIVNGKINYWTFPISFSWTSYSRNKFRHGINISYLPSFEGKKFFDIKTFGGAEQSSFSSSYKMGEQSFQHTLLFSFSNQFYMAAKRIRISIDPFAGIGSSYFKDAGTSINTFSFGINLSLEFGFHLPQITIEKITNNGNAEEKKQLLEQKQKEIEDQLNKQPK